MTNSSPNPQPATTKAGPKLIRFVYKKPALVVFLCPLIHTNKIVTNAAPNIAKIRLGERPREAAWPGLHWLEQENQHDYHTSLPAKRTAYSFIFYRGLILFSCLREAAGRRHVWVR